jgi:acyl carrier protein
METAIEFTKEAVILNDITAVRVNRIITEIISQKLGIEKSALKPDTSFSDHLGADSLDVFEMIMEVEKKFKIQIPDEEAEKLFTVGRLVRYVGQKVA